MKAKKSITTITKRDGQTQKYHRQKITSAISKALQSATHHPQVKLAQQLALEVEKILTRNNQTHVWSVEAIQDVVEQVLLSAGQSQTAQAYILYRNRQAKLRTTNYELRTTNYLGMTQNAYLAMSRRYLKKNADEEIIETPLQAMKRVVGALSLGKKWHDKSLEAMTAFEFVPAGCYFRGARSSSLRSGVSGRAGNKSNGSLANCFVLPVGDSITEIFEAVKWSAQIHQMGGGTGFNFSHLRPRGDRVGSGGLSSGPVNFMKAFDAETEIVMQGGAHRGANMGILNVDHPDIFEFIRAKSVDGEVSNFNISVGVSDRFMQSVKKGGAWNLINPRNHRTVKKIPTRSLWQPIVELAHQTGDPGMIFLDAVNRVNPLLKSLGPIDATNVCGEQALYPFDVCNLGSINLAKFVIKPWWEGRISFFEGIDRPPGLNLINNNRQTGRSLSEVDNPTKSQSIHHRATRKKMISEPTKLNNINWSRLEAVIRLAVRFLDHGIDASTYPIPQIENLAHRLRRIGLGIMGWADMLAQLGVPYDSDTGVKIAEKVMKFIHDISWDESEHLAKEKGVFPLWKDSYFAAKNNPFGRVRRVRNVAVTTIAPTGTISMVADCSSGIEPYFALEYTKNVVEKGGLKYTNKYYEKAKDSTMKQFNNVSILKSVFPTAHEISPESHLRMQAAFQRYTDNAVSKTINFPSSAAKKDVEKAYLLAWELGCKGITVYRDGSRRQQILKSSSTVRLSQSQLQITPLSQRAYQLKRRQIIEATAVDICPECSSVLEMVEGCFLCRNCGYSKCSL